VDVSLVIRHRLRELGLDQKDLAAAAQVTESYISQLLARKKAPPAPGRTDLYDKIGEFLKLPRGELSQLADLQRQEELKKKVSAPPRPLFRECRELALRKCDPDLKSEIEEIFAKHPFGELERLVMQKLLDVAQSFAREELRSEERLRFMAELSHRTYEQMRVAILEFLDTDVFSITPENCVAFLDPIIESWDIDLKTFRLEIVLNRDLAPGRTKHFEFVERESESQTAVEPGLEQFLKDAALSGGITEEESRFLGRLRFNGRRPSALYYYRELQNLRDPLHFQAAGRTKRSTSPPPGILRGESPE
jgi:transcriptional regulator with XRE-family HTH domain